MIVNRVIFCLLAIVLGEISGLFTRNIKEKFKKQLHIHDHHHHHHHHHNQHLTSPPTFRGSRHREAHNVLVGGLLTEKPKTAPRLVRPRSSTTTTTTTTKATTTQETTTNPTTTLPTTTETTTEISTTETPITEESFEETTNIVDEEQHYKHLKQVFVVNKNLQQELRKGFLNTPTPPRKPLRFITTEKPMSTSRKPHKYQMQKNIPMIHATTKKPAIRPDILTKNKIVSTSIINYFNNPKSVDQKPHQYGDDYKSIGEHQNTQNSDDYYKHQSPVDHYDDYYKNVDHYKSPEEHHNSHYDGGDEYTQKPLHHNDYKHTYGSYGSDQNDHWNGDSKYTKTYTPKMKKSKIKYTINYDNYEKNKEYGGHFSYPPPTSNVFLEEQHHLHFHGHKHNDGESHKLFNLPGKLMKDKPDTSYSASYFKLWS